MFSRWENPPPPLDFDHENSTVLKLYKPEDNPVIRMMSEATFQSVIHLLDQTYLVTPPASEDEEPSSVKEPGEIISPLKANKEESEAIEIEEPAAIVIEQPVMKSIEMDDSIITKNLFEYVAAEKRKKICAPEKSTAKKKTRREDKDGKKKKKRYRHESKISDHSNSNSPTFDKGSQLRKSRTGTSPNRSSSRPKSPSVIGHKRSKSPSLDYAPNRHRSVSASRSPDIDPIYGRSGRKSPRYLSPTRRSPSHRRNRRKSPSRYSSARRSPSPLLPRWSPDRRSPSPLLSRWSPSRRSPSPLLHRWSPSRRSPSPLLPRWSPSHRSPSGSPGRRPSSRRSPSHRSFSRKSSIRRSPTRRSPTGSPRRRPSSRRSPNRKSSVRLSPSRRSHSGSPSRGPRRRRNPSGSSTHQKSVNRPKRYGSLSPDKSSRRKSPIPDQFPSRKSPPSECVSASSNRTPDGERRSDTIQEKESVEQPQNIPPAKPEIRRLPGTNKFHNFPANDEYSQLLAEEMKKRRLIDYSDDSEAGSEPTVIGEKSGTTVKLGVSVKKEAVAEEESTPLTEDQENLVKFELGIVNPDEMESDASFPQTKYFKKESSIKSESPERKKGILNSYYCKVCQLGLNSELTWQSHITGKKHAKLLRNLNVHEIAKGSISIPATPAIVSEDIPRFANPAAGKKRMLINDIPRLQPAIDGERHRPLPGLDYLQEIVSEMDINYYCELCDAPCGPSSVMPHLIGYKHQLRCLREISPERYERNKLSLKKQFEKQLSKRLMGHERKFGRGRMKVFLEQDDPLTRPLYDQPPGPSWRNSSSIPHIKKELKEDGETELPINDECLDTTKGDFFCKLCDAHMNNVNMWEAHVRGKRHLKNAKKIPGENISKVRSVKLPGAVSKLERDIDEDETLRHELIVGLDYIRETRGSNGENYNCFLCGSCSTIDIIDHILLPKHRLRYLEKLDTEGVKNAVSTINQMELQDPWFRSTLVNDECRRMVEMYGRGRVEVYVSKN